MDIGNGRKLYAHQVEAVHLMLNQSCVIAHDMGLGKTLAALVAAKHASDQGALVVVVARSTCTGTGGMRRRGSGCRYG